MGWFVRELDTEQVFDMKINRPLKKASLSHALCSAFI